MGSIASAAVMSDKEVKEVQRLAEAAGWDVTMDGSGHMRLTPPGSKLGVSFSTTPGDVRARKNNIATLRRMGLDISTGESIAVECANTWHTDPLEGRFCPTCRQDWVQPETKDRAFNSLILNGTPMDEAVSAVMTLTTRPSDTDVLEPVRKAILSFEPGVFVKLDDVADLCPRLKREDVSSQLRELKRMGEITRTKHGKWGRPQPEVIPEEVTVTVTETEQPNPYLENVVQEKLAGAASTFFEAPPDPTKEWRWSPDRGWVEAARAADAPPIFEYVTTDAHGRLVLRREDGELFCAVPLAPQF